MVDTYRVVALPVSGGRKPFTYGTQKEALAKIRELSRDVLSFDAIFYIEYDGFDIVYESTIWNNPVSRWEEDVCH